MIPKIEHPLDTSNFRAILDDDVEPEISKGEDSTNAFKDFTPITRPEKQLHAL